MKIQKNKLERFKKKFKALTFFLVLLLILGLQGCAFVEAVKDVAEMGREVNSINRSVKSL